MQALHMSGAGNDFVVLDVRGRQLPLEQLAVELCRLRHADGLLAVDDARDGDLRLHFYNSDGSRGEMCGNGARCVCRYACDMGLAGPELRLQTDAGPVLGWRLSRERYRVQLNLPGVLDRRCGGVYVELGSPGVPHFVTELPEMSWELAQQLRPRARALCHGREFPKGANVSFYRELAPGRVRVLTYERGVEDYTMACGTGCASVAVALSLAGRLPGGTLEAENRGGTLLVTVQGDKTPEAIFLEGPAEVLDEFEF